MRLDCFFTSKACCFNLLARALIRELALWTSGARLAVTPWRVSMALDTQSSGILRFATFEVDLRAGELRKQGKRIKLQEQPFHVLTVLLRRPGEVVTREELRNQNWPPDTFVDFDNSLNTAINKLREALGDSADNPRFIETQPRRGYRFIARVTGDSQKGSAPSLWGRRIVLVVGSGLRGRRHK